MRTNIEIDEKLMADAMKSGPYKTSRQRKCPGRARARAEEAPCWLSLTFNAFEDLRDLRTWRH